ncbi:Crp/Fnr family transcriptional regulator [Comamonas granuli]|uniref:Crp/Fnr family transcriptional regulator n=1 Tax=Comamonas granuli TaxID=290309 RepID=UPI000693D902|nr:Crp/Fnr family transcriptional regulator [Comamonas granuli]
MADLLHVLTTGAQSPSSGLPTAAPLAVCLRRVPAGRYLMHAGAPSEALYVVRTGTFKIAHSDEEGYEQVLAFADRGALLAYDALCIKHHPTSAVALEDSTVFAILWSDLDGFCRQVPAFERELHRALSLALSHTHDLLDIMAAVSSEVRLARFLLRHSSQLAARGQSPRRFVLRMGRRDLASMLGVAHETVSRAFTTLATAGLLQVNDRYVEILDLEGLRTFSRSTRRPPEQAAPLRRSGPARRTAARAPPGTAPLPL